jgi:hypothetical protein
MTSLQFTLYAAPDQPLIAHGFIELCGRSFKAFQVAVEPTALVETTALGCSFEELLERLACLPRMFIELDGSFVWTGSEADSQSEVESQSTAESFRQSHSRWQLDGMIYDWGNQVRRIELKGNCSPDAWLQFINHLQAPTDLVAWLPQVGCYLQGSDLVGLWTS